jgi:hypothetical protein
VRTVAAVATVAMAVLLAGCRPSPSHVDTPVTYPWQLAALPGPGQGERAVVRAASACGGRWYLTGAIVGADGSPRPAAWVSDDAVSWKSMRLEPNTYYGRLNTLYSAGCRFGFLAALGAKTGGAHGFPRTSNWYERTDGVLDQIEQPYTLYGGPEGVNVARIVGGPSAWMETGNRVGGAAVWSSADAETFRLTDSDPALRSGAGLTTWADDVRSTPSGWVVVGSVTLAGHIDADPAVWIAGAGASAGDTSADVGGGTSWRRVSVPATAAYEEIQRVTTMDSDVIGVGIRGTGFGAWRGSGDSWRLAGVFGDSGGPGKGGAVALTVVAGRLLAVTTDGATYTAWQSTDRGTSWRRVTLPLPAPASADQVSTAYGLDDQVVLVIDDGTASHVWTAALAGAN